MLKKSMFVFASVAALAFSTVSASAAEKRSDAATTGAVGSATPVATSWTTTGFSYSASVKDTDCSDSPYVAIGRIRAYYVGGGYDTREVVRDTCYTGDSTGYTTVRAAWSPIGSKRIDRITFIAQSGTKAKEGPPVENPRT